MKTRLSRYLEFWGKIFTLVAVGVGSGELLAQDLRPVYNAVLVDPTSLETSASTGVKPFYISIFEASCSDLRRVLGTSTFCFADGTDYPLNNSGLDTSLEFSREAEELPATTGYFEAERFCQLQGGRLPTRQEWRMAAFDLYRNKNSTSYDDRKVKSLGSGSGSVPYSNFGYRYITYLNQRGEYDSSRLQGLAPTTELEVLGPEVSGTVGMIANVREWVDNGSDSDSVWDKSFCGLSYYSATVDIEAAAADASGGCGQGSQTNGVRCVFDYDENLVQVIDSSVVKGMLRRVIDHRQKKRQEHIIADRNNSSIVGFFPAIFIDFPKHVYSRNRGLDYPRPLKRDPHLLSVYQNTVLNFIHEDPRPSTEVQDSQAITIRSKNKGGSPNQRLQPPPKYGEKFSNIYVFPESSSPEKETP